MLISIMQCNIFNKLGQKEGVLERKSEREMGREIVNGEIEEMLSESCSNEANKLPFLSLNHASLVCKSVKKSVQFYGQVLRFVLIKRPSSFDFGGAWLFNHGIGIHLLETAENVLNKKKKINPKDNHISFQCSDMELIIQKLEEMKIEYVTAVVKGGGISVDQLFFHDPDGYMIEICNCQNLPVLPLSSCPLKKLPNPNDNLTTSSLCGNKMLFNREVEALMLENLAAEMMDISI